MKDYALLEVEILHNTVDSKECANEVISSICGHDFCRDGTVNISKIDKRHI